jgi:rod shape-determining protein MreB and related proteins
MAPIEAILGSNTLERSWRGAMRIRPGLAIDLGTVNTLFYVAGRGLVVEEPSVVALNRATGKVAAVGAVADSLSGKEPEGIEIVWPLRDGVIADVEAATLLVNAYLHRARVHRFITRPMAVICVPRSATWMERRAVESAVASKSPHCGVRLIDEPVAASMGSGVSPTDRDGAFVVDVGGGTTEVAVVAGGGVVRARSLRVGGNAMDESIAHAVKAEFGISLGPRASERLKITLGLTGGENGWAEVIGVDAARDGLRSERVPGELVVEALGHTVRAIVAAIHEVLSEIPPDLAEDVVRGKIRLAGGGALLSGLPQAIEASTGIATCVVDDPLRCVVRGAAEVLNRGEGISGYKAA